jgi:hypothetical protein
MPVSTEGQIEHVDGVAMPRDSGTQSAEQEFYPRIPLYRKRRRYSFGLAAMFGVVTAAAVVAAAMKMKERWGVAFVADVWLAAVGVYSV